MTKLRQYNDTMQNLGKKLGCVSSVLCVSILLMFCIALLLRVAAAGVLSMHVP